jgi:hypothetical protein
MGRRERRAETTDVAPLARRGEYRPRRVYHNFPEASPPSRKSVDDVTTTTTDPRQPSWTRRPYAPPSKVGRRLRRIGAVMDDVEYADFEAAARQRGVSLANLIRIGVREVIQRDRQERQEAATAAVG